MCISKKEVDEKVLSVNFQSFCLRFQISVLRLLFCNTASLEKEIFLLCQVGSPNVDLHFIQKRKPFIVMISFAVSVHISKFTFLHGDANKKYLDPLNMVGIQCVSRMFVYLQWDVDERTLLNTDSLCSLFMSPLPGCPFSDVGGSQKAFLLFDLVEFNASFLCVCLSISK